MHPFTLRRAGSSHAALEFVAADGGTRYLAGGTTLVDLMKLGIERPTALVDITGLPDLDRVEIDSQGDLRIGALARMSDVADDPRVIDGWPMLARALVKGASAQLRNMATIGGNLLQRTRCPYFRDAASRCNKRNPGVGCDALEGINREHALLGVSDRCIALHPSDFCVALAPLDASVEVMSPNGARRLSFEELHCLPGQTPHLEHALEQGELITAVVVPPSPAARRSTYVKVRDRESYQFAMTSVAAGLDLDADGRVRDARIGLGGVATKPWRAREVELFLHGRTIDESTAQQAGRVAMTGAVERDHNAFKVPLMAYTVAEALLSLTTQGNTP